MATQHEITDAIDAGIATAWPEIVERQETFRAAHGRYFQGLCTHSELPADGQPAPPDQLGDHPSYQSESWLDVGYDLADPLAALAIDQYQGPQGEGYVCSFRVSIAGDIWRRQINVGPESYRETAWQTEPLDEA